MEKKNKSACFATPAGCAHCQLVGDCVTVTRPELAWVQTALMDDWVFSVFHPIVDARTGETFAHEALIRARRPGTDIVIGAGQLLDACTHLSLAHVLDQQARKAAIRGAVEHQVTGKIFINFLPNAIYDPEVCLRTTMEAAAQHRLDPSRLVFEVVETERIPDMKRLQRILDYYRERGMGTAVDDMGAGHTSIDYLEALRPDYVKMDRDLIVRSEHDPDARICLQFLSEAARDLGIRVIMEGVETPGQLQVCRDAGADFIQGFLFARPAAPPQRADLSALLSRAA